MDTQSISKQQIKTQSRQAVQGVEQTPHCSVCGTPCHPGDKFCEECGSALGAGACAQCGAPVAAGWEICPQCGYALPAGSCSFCGATVEAADAFCQECGNPRAGIRCPDCGLLNFRSFCRGCNRPLNEMAQQACAQARHDPLFGKMLALQQELAQMEEALTLPPVQMSAQDQALVARYKSLLQPVNKPKTATPRVQKAALPKIQLTLVQPDQVDLEAAYLEKVAQMRKLMEQLAPPPDASPQMQRNYYSARKLPVTRKTVTKVPSYWVCNLCSARHRQPSECAQPELGGTWFYEDIITSHQEFAYEDE